MPQAPSPLLVAAVLGLWGLPALAGLCCQLELFEPSTAGLAGSFAGILLTVLAVRSDAIPLLR